MTFLPIVDRELRVAARKRGTFWLRIVAALVALVIGGGFLTLNALAGGSAPSLGRGLFGVLTWLSLAVALSAGVFFTSDCLSEEKREGTLGFLFLTDLRGYDVVLGKLLATSLRGFYALLAVFPILAVALLMGGVTGPQFWKTLLALVNALWYSLAAGLFVSAISRDAQKAMSAALLLLLLLVAGGPIADAAVAGVQHRNFTPALSLLSPGYVFVSAGAWGQTRYWKGLFTSQAVAWLLLAMACGLIPRTWQERSAKKAISKGWAYAWKYGGGKRRVALRRKLIGLNPVLWLACRERWQSAAIWTLTIVVLGTFIVLLASNPPSEVWMAWSFVGAALTLAFYLGAASQACRFFVEARRSGLIELLLATPLTAREIVQGQWRALQRMFGLPVTLYLCVQIIGSTLSQHLSWGGVAKSMGGEGPNLALTIATAAITAIVITANLVALSWFGMWMGLTSKNANLATLKTLVFVQIIPSFVNAVVSGMVVGLLMVPLMAKGKASSPTRFMLWYPFFTAVVTGILSLAKDIFFTALARRKLYSEFRELAVRGVAPIQLSLPPIIAVPPNNR